MCALAQAWLGKCVLFSWPYGVTEVRIVPSVKAILQTASEADHSQTQATACSFTPHDITLKRQKHC